MARAGSWATIIVAGIMLAGCGSSAKVGPMAAAPPVSKVADTITTGSLAEQKKAVAIMKIDAVSQECLGASVTLGQRDGDAFKVVETLRVAGPRVPNRSNVAEAELAAGEYHVIAYTCQLALRGVTMARLEGGKHRSSYASFTVSPGEIVNLGHLKLIPLTVSQQVANVRVTNNIVQVVVSDWSMQDLDGFKKDRPALYKDMRTRLAVVTKTEPMNDAQRKELCDRAKGLMTEGKIQNLPPACAPGAGQQAPGPGRKGKAAVNT